MQLKLNSQQISESIYSQSVLLSLESALSWPMPLMKDGKLLLTFFLYLTAGPRGDRYIWYPHHCVIVDTESVEHFEFIPAKPEEFGGLPGGQPLARQGGDYLGAMTLDEFEVLAAQLFQSIDGILEFYHNPISVLSQGEREIVGQCRNLFHRLTQPELWPVYRAANSQFFEWIDESTPQCDISAS